MIDLDTYRYRIGIFKQGSCKINSNKSYDKYLESHYNYDKFWLLVILGSIIGLLCAIPLINTKTTFNMEKEACHFKNVQKWNQYMKCYNGNVNYLNIAHWNGGSSYLCKNQKGRDKLKNIKF